MVMRFEALKFIRGIGCVCETGEIIGVDLESEVRGLLLDFESQYSIFTSKLAETSLIIAK